MEQKDHIKPFLGDYIKEITAKSKGKNQYICPFCGSGTGSNETGAFTYYPETNTYHCFACGEHGDIFDLYAHQNNFDLHSDFAKIIDELSKKYGIYDKNTADTSKTKTGEREHIYKNADGSIFGKKVINKFSDGTKKAFWVLFDRDKNNFCRNTGLSGNKAPLYNADLLHSRTDNMVFVVEGEKDADTLVKWGFLATTIPNGAGFSNWIDLYNNELQNRDIIIITDNDEPGRKYGETVARNVIKTAKSLKIIPSATVWEKCPEKGDISDISQLLGEEKTRELLISALKNVNFYQSQPESDNKNKQSSAPKIMYTPIKLSDVQSEKRDFLWNPYIPIGEITVMFAAGGTGKSFATIGIAADITAGRMLPKDGEKPTNTNPERVLFISAEDTAGIIKSRMQKINSNLNNCILIKTPSNRHELKEDSFLLPQSKDDNERIEAFASLLSEVKPKLVIIDPWSVYIGDDKNMNKANDVRGITTVLTTLAKEFECAMLIIAHVNKMPQMENANNAVSGSTALIDAARSAICIRSLSADSDRRVMIHTKANYSKKGKAVCYRIIDEGDRETARFQWDGFCNLTGDDLTAAARSGKKLTDIAEEKEDEAENTQIVIDVITRISKVNKKIPISYNRFRTEIIEECGIDFLGSQPKKEIYKALSALRSHGISIEFPTGTVRGLKKDGTHEKNSKGFYIYYLTDNSMTKIM